MDVHSIPTTTHGRVLIRQATASGARGLLVGFHGYMENAAIQLARLEAIPGADAWTLLSVQGLHRFYRARSQEVIASWMTREDRDDAIADNIAYVDNALRLVAPDARASIVHVGFSQGVAMAFRAALRGERSAAGVIAIAGDVPPELLADAACAFPPVLLVRGEADEWYTAAKLDADVAALRGRGVDVEVMVHPGGHDWTPRVAEAANGWLKRILSPHRQSGQSGVATERS
jgi:predicted esterase